MVGKRIRDLRVKSGMTQNDLGKRVGVIKQTVSSWENESSSPSYDILVLIANIFNVPTDYILGNGIFKEWETIVRNKKKVMEAILIASKRLSDNLSFGVDDITFIRLAYAFNVKVTEQEGGIGIDLCDPFPTYSSTLFGENKKSPLADEQGDLIVQRALKNTGLLAPDGTLPEKSIEVLSDFLANNADMLKKLIENDD